MLMWVYVAHMNDHMEYCHTPNTRRLHRLFSFLCHCAITMIRFGCVLGGSHLHALYTLMNLVARR